MRRHNNECILELLIGRIYLRFADNTVTQWLLLYIIPKRLHSAHICYILFTDGPRQLNISPLTPIYTVTETNTSVGPITCSADCKPDCSLTWSGPTIPNGTTSVINLKHIAQTQAGNYKCSATNNVGSLTLVKFIVIFHCEYYLLDITIIKIS